MRVIHHDIPKISADSATSEVRDSRASSSLQPSAVVSGVVRPGDGGGGRGTRLRRCEDTVRSLATRSSGGAVVIAPHRTSSDRPACEITKLQAEHVCVLQLLLGRHPTYFPYVTLFIFSLKTLYCCHCGECLKSRRLGKLNVSLTVHQELTI